MRSFAKGTIIAIYSLLRSRAPSPESDHGSAHNRDWPLLTVSTYGIKHPVPGENSKNTCCRALVVAPMRERLHLRDSGPPSSRARSAVRIRESAVARSSLRSRLLHQDLWHESQAPSSRTASNPSVVSFSVSPGHSAGLLQRSLDDQFSSYTSTELPT